jgi:short-subunit dehydrogenase
LPFERGAKEEPVQYKRAMVTGASSGIGKAFAEILAAEGSDLVVVARNRQRLNDLAIQLRTRFRCEIEILEADLESLDDLARVEARLRDQDDIDLLVNNAGYGHAGAFARLPIEKSMGQIDCNVRALTRLAHAALQSMTTARRGAILNVASGAAFLPTPGLAVYAATKAYVLSFTQALHEEARGDGVTVSVVCPGFTRTEFQQRANYDAGSIPGFAWQSAEQVAREALAALRARKVICVPGIQNKLTMGVVNLVPRSAIAGLVGRMTRQ